MSALVLLQVTFCHSWIATPNTFMRDHGISVGTFLGYFLCFKNTRFFLTGLQNAEPVLQRWISLLSLVWFHTNNSPCTGYHTIKLCMFIAGYLLPDGTQRLGLSPTGLTPWLWHLPSRRAVWELTRPARCWTASGSSAHQHAMLMRQIM